MGSATTATKLLTPWITDGESEHWLKESKKFPPMTLIGWAGHQLTVVKSTLHSPSNQTDVSRIERNRNLSVTAFYEKVVKVKADVAAFLINCFPSA
jgi:hypothetical protein